jgi:hypothetical protein
LRSRFALLAAVIVPLALAGAPAHAQSLEAETHFKRGVSLYQEADFKAALVEFRRAYELSHNWRLLYNVAQAEYQTHDYAASLMSFETFLREGGDRIPRPRRVEVEQEIARLRMRVGKVTIRANVGGATVLIDDEVLGPAPITRNVAVGGRRVVVKKDGYHPWSKSLEMASGDDLLFDAVLEPLVSSPGPSVAPPPAPAENRFLWEPWAVTGVLTAAAVTTGILALGAASKLDDAKGRYDVTDSELDDVSSRAKTFALVTDILVLAAVASAGVSVYFTIKSSSSPSSASVRLSPSASGVLAWGQF